jgi:hypothetical protein
MHIEHLCSFFSATIDGRNLIFGHKEKNATKNILDGQKDGQRQTEVKQYTPFPFGERGYNETGSSYSIQIPWKN